MLTLILIFAGALLAFGVSTLAGGGAGLVLIPLLGLALPAASVPGALSIGTAVSSASRFVAFRSAVRWDMVRWFTPAALPFAVLGAWLLTRLPSTHVDLLLGLFLLGNVLFAAGRSRKSAQDQPAMAAPQRMSPARVMTIGVVAGFVSGFAGAVGVLFNDVYIRSGLRRDEIVATRAASEVALHVVKLTAYALLGVMTGKTVAVGLLVAAAAVLATVAARPVLGRLGEVTFRRLNYAAMGLAGCAMVTVSTADIADRQGLTFDTRRSRDGLVLSMGWPGTAITSEWSLGEWPEVDWRRDQAAADGDAPVE